MNPPRFVSRGFQDRSLTEQTQQTTRRKVLRESSSKKGAQRDRDRICVRRNISAQAILELLINYFRFLEFRIIGSSHPPQPG